MGGLALGSYFGGKWIDRGYNPLTAYALLEAAIGIYCVLIPHLIDWAHPIFQAIYLHSGESFTQASIFRFLVCGSILIIPTTLMGATLPVLSKFVSTDESFIGRDVGTLYSLNTFGAVCGALGSVFLFMRVWGLESTIYFAAALNVGIALVIFVVFKPGALKLSENNPSAVAPSSGKSFSSRVIFLLICFAASGVCALIYQVAWNRILSLLLGSSVYAFSLILTIFILGLALGTVCFARLEHRFKDPMKVFGLLQLGIAVSALLALPLFGDIPFINRWVYANWGSEFGLIQWTNFLIIFCLLVVPTFFMGGQFPIIIKLIARDISTLGHNVGQVYASNTVGTIVGSFLGGFLLVPWLGIQTTVILAVLVNLAIGLVLLASCESLRSNIKHYGLPLIALAILWQASAVKAWDHAVISSGSFMPYRIEDLSHAEAKSNRILFYKEGVHTTVTTELSVSGNIFLKVNGKTDASLALDMRTQLLSGYLPMFFHANPKSALVIGQGSGITLGAVEQFPVESIDLVEISSTVIEGSRFFSPFNHHALDDNRVNLILEDGRNHVALSGKKYDVIVSEPSNPWISGVGVLFTLDFFKLLKANLNDDGIACIWVHTNMSPESFKSIIRSFHEEFPYVTMWESIVGDDYLLIGSPSELKLSYEQVEHHLRDETKGQDLRSIEVHNVRDLMSLMAMNQAGISAFSRGAPIHTDDNSLLEFSAPKYIYRDERDVLVRQLTPFIKIDDSILTFTDTDDERRDRILKEIRSVSRSESQINEIKKNASIDNLLNSGEDAFNRGQAGRALAFYEEILRIDPNHVLAWFNKGNVFHSLKQYEEALQAFDKTLSINPYYVFGNVALAKVHLANSQPEKAIDILQPLFKWYPGDTEVRFYLGLAYAMLKNVEQSIVQFEFSVDHNPDYAPAHYYLGLQQTKRDGKIATKHLRQFLKLAKSGQGQDKMIAKAKSLLGLN